MLTGSTPGAVPLQKLTKFRHPWTNGQVEVFNRVATDRTTKTYHYDTPEQLKAHLMAFVLLYNFQRPLRALKYLSPYDKNIEIFGTMRWVPLVGQKMVGLKRESRRLGFSVYAARSG